MQKLETQNEFNSIFWHDAKLISFEMRGKETDKKINYELILNIDTIILDRTPDFCYLLGSKAPTYKCQVIFSNVIIFRSDLSFLGTDLWQYQIESANCNIDSELKSDLLDELKNGFPDEIPNPENLLHFYFELFGGGSTISIIAENYKLIKNGEAEA